MQGASPSVKPLSAGESRSSVSDEVVQLELQSQRQLEEDVARIFDESIYSDLEVVCGKLKILTNSCILKARTHKFYNKLESILHVNIGRNAFDEIYSFISDVYTECDINRQEEEIINYINKNLSLGNNAEENVEPEIYSTPNCESPEEKSYQKSLGSSPSKELTKEYYSLVPIDGNALDKELVEQDALSNAFQSINKSQLEDIKAKQSIQFAKPTSLCLDSSHIPKINKHSNSCDMLKNPDSNSDIDGVDIEKKKINNGPSETRKTIEQSAAEKCLIAPHKTSVLPDYTPDSLVTDEPSSSSDYLSAAYAVSPGTAFSSDFSQLNVGINATKMDNLVTDSGLETSGTLESLNSNKDTTLTDVSLTESTVHDMINDDNNCQESATNALDKSHSHIIKCSTSLNSPTCSTSTRKDLNDKKTNKPSFTETSIISTKEEKQRQNEEIVILESSSLSSETGSWESVFPPKLQKKALEEMPNNSNIKHETHDDLCPSLVQKSPYKSTSCFIDAASLADEGDDIITIQPETKNSFTGTEMFKPSQPVPCTLKRDLSPNDWSGSIDNEDSLEVAENKDSDSVQKDLSPTMFEMTPITEDSLGWNACEATAIDEQKNLLSKHNPIIDGNDTMNLCANTAGATVPVVQDDPQATDKPFGTNIAEATVVVEQEDAQAVDKPFGIKTSGDTAVNLQENPQASNKPCGINTAEAAAVVEQNPQATNDPIIAGNGFVTYYSNTVGRGTVETEQKNPIKTHNLIKTDTSFVSAAEIQGALSTPNNSMISVSGLDFKISESESENDTSGSKYDNSFNLSDHWCDTPSTMEGSLNISSLKNTSLFGTHSNSKLTKREIENIPIVSGAYIPDPEEIPERPPRVPSNSSFWVVDMASSSKSESGECSDKLHNKPIDISMELASTSKSGNSGESYKSQYSVNSDSGVNSTRKFYIDLTTLPPVLSSEARQDKDEGSEKKNIFSMFIDLGNNSTTAKEKPIFSSSLNTKKMLRTEGKSGPKPSTSKMSSATTTAADATDDNILFEKLESLCEDPSIPVSEILKRPLNLECPVDAPEVSNAELQDEGLKENENKKEPVELFVKLSDLDKPVPRVEPETDSDQDVEERMSRSIPDNAWGESSQRLNSRSNAIISSFHSENAESLNRLFPHLKNNFSRSMPGRLQSTRSPSGQIASPGDIDERQASDGSEMSSAQSSYCRSIVGNSTSEDTDRFSSLINSCQSRLGQDLLRMFLEEVAPDVLVEVSGRRIKAHKCILSSRCQYFAAILSGGWVESAGNIITLPPFSFNVVHFALCHIYSGVSVIPESVGIVELATVADMLCLEGLKDGIMFLLKDRYCHHFHQPCPLCVVGVLEVFPLAAVYGLEELFRKCLRWITKYLYRVWTAKAFATLPVELLEKCYNEQIINLSLENFLEVVYGCGMVLASLASCWWAGMVVRMCQRLLNATAHFGAANLCEVMRATSVAPADVPPAAMRALHDFMAGAIEWAPPDQLCRSYHLLCALVTELRANNFPRPDPPRYFAVDGETPPPPRTRSQLSTHADTWRMLSEGSIVRNTHRIVNTAAFASLPVDLRKRLQTLGCIQYRGGQSAASTRGQRRPRPSAGPRNYDSGRPRAYRLQQQQYQQQQQQQQFQQQQLLCTVYARVNSVTISRNMPPGAQCNKPREERPGAKMVKTFPPCVRTTKAQEERAKYNLTKTNQAVEREAPRPTRAWSEQAKPRYMEPRQPKEKPSARKPQPRRVSSSDSSRNSSPVQHNARVRRALCPPLPPAAATATPPSSASAATTAPPRPRLACRSTDSLGEPHNANKYATYTKAKHNTERSVEAVHTPAKIPVPANVVSQPANIPANAESQPANVRANSENQPANVPANAKSQPGNVRANSENQRANVPANAKSQQANVRANSESQTANVPANAESQPANVLANAGSQLATAPNAKSIPKTTKIPVYQNKSAKTFNTVSAASKESQRRAQGDKSMTNSLSPLPQRSKPVERKPSGSLMNATKSSQAKVVLKTVKETTNTKCVSKQEKPKCKNACRSPRSPSAVIPVMERSGTFLKDEPMFGANTTNIDIDE